MAGDTWAWVSGDSDINECYAESLMKFVEEQYTNGATPRGKLDDGSICDIVNLASIAILL